MRKIAIRRNRKQRKYTSGSRNLSTENVNILEQMAVQLISVIGVERTEELIAENFTAEAGAKPNSKLADEILKESNSVIDDLIVRLEKVELWIQQHEQNDEGKLGGVAGKDFELWNQILLRIQRNISKPSFDTWFAGTTAKRLDDDGLLIECKNEFHADWLEKSYKEEIFFAVKEVAGKSYDIEFVSIGKWVNEE